MALNTSKRPTASQFLAALRMLVIYLIAEHRKNVRPLFVGLISVFLVVLFLTLVRNTLVKSPLVFLKIAEESMGQMDLLMTSNNVSNPFLNASQLSENLHAPLLAGACLRWFTTANITESPKNPWEPLPLPASVAATATVLILNTTAEKKIGLSPSWPFRALGIKEAHVSKALLQFLNKNPQRGDQITLQLDILSLLPDGTSVGEVTIRNKDIYTKLTPTQVRQIALVTGADYFTVMSTAVDLGDGKYLVSGRTLFRNQFDQFTVIQQALDVIDALPATTYGKYPSGLGNIIILEQEATNIFIKEWLLQLTRSPLFLLSNAFDTSIVSTFELSHYVTSIVLLLKDRVQLYMQSQNDIQKVLNRFSDQIMYRIGINTPIQLTDVLNKPLNMFAQTRLFWNQSYIIITIILVLLSILLIYTLLLSNVEEKTFEFGLLRTLGLAQPRLFLLMFLQAMMFAIPGIVFGIIVCLILYVPIDYLLGRFTEVPLTLFLDWGAGVLGVTLGLFLPLLGMWVPVRRVLTATLRDALDKYHQSVFDVIVSIKKLNDLGIHQNQTVLALIMVGLSILVFYSGPVSFKMNFLETFMQIMSVLFIVLILGQVLLMHLVQPILQRLILHCIVWGPDCLFKQIIQKNLFAHRSRNHKAALTFTLCISYLLCSGALFQMQLNSLVENLQWSIGADILISSDTYSNALPENTLNQFLTQNSTNPSVALSWTYVSYPLQSLPMVKKIKFSSLAAINRATVQVIGVESNYLDVTFNDPFFFPVALNDPDSSPFTQLSDMKRMPVIISEATSNYVFLSLSDVSRLDISYFKQGNSVWSTAFSILCKNIGIIKKLPGFPTINRMTKLNAPLFISMQSFQGLLHRLVQEAEWTSINTNIVPKEHLRIRLNPNADQNTLDFFINSLGTTIQKTLGSNIKIKVLHDNIKIAETSVFFVNIFFNTVAMVGIILSFFVLWLSFSSSIRESVLEFGILRAIGVKASTVSRIYIYESLIVVFSSILSGTLIGLVTTITLTLQVNLFTEMPFVLHFPIFLYIFVVLLSILMAILGSYLPSRELSRHSPSMLLKSH